MQTRITFFNRMACFQYLILVAGLGFNFLVKAQQVTSVQDVVIRALDVNPDLQASWHAFKASDYQVGEARAGYFPSVDLAATAGKASRDFDGRDRYTTAQGQLSLVQNVFDGFRTLGQVEHLEGGRLVRYYELLNSIENTALETVHAYEDVLRERALVALAKQNYTKHQEVYTQIQERATSGVGRKVDLEQVAGRLALAEANLLTEASNLHDVTARYLRVSGQLPAANLAPTGLAESKLPENIRAALQLAYESNAGFHAAIKNIAASQANVKVARSGYLPKADLRARQIVSRNTNGFDERIDPSRYGDENAVELAITYNIFAGGANRSAVRRSLEEVNQAKDLRDKACVDLRQTTQIAFNDARRIREQLNALEQHRRSSEKVRVAYGDQFKIGQRTLLDLLDAENEYFQASRAYQNAMSDLTVAHARTLTAMGKLLPALEITRDTLAKIKEAEVNDEIKIDAHNACPVEEIESLGRRDLISEVVRLNSDALFSINSSTLAPGAAQRLDGLIQQLKTLPNLVEIKIDGHTDNSGSDIINLPLSKARAESVKNYFILNSVEGISFQTQGFGSARPVMDNSTDAGRAANRRVEITILHQPEIAASSQ